MVTGISVLLPDVVTENALDNLKYISSGSISPEAAGVPTYVPSMVSPGNRQSIPRESPGLTTGKVLCPLLSSSSSSPDGNIKFTPTPCSFCESFFFGFFIKCFVSSA